MRRGVVRLSGGLVGLWSGRSSATGRLHPHVDGAARRAMGNVHSVPFVPKEREDARLVRALAASVLCRAGFCIGVVLHARYRSAAAVPETTLLRVTYRPPKDAPLRPPAASWPQQQASAPAVQTSQPAPTRAAAGATRATESRAPDVDVPATSRGPLPGRQGRQAQQGRQAGAAEAALHAAPRPAVAASETGSSSSHLPGPRPSLSSPAQVARRVPGMRRRLTEEELERRRARLTPEERMRRRKYDRYNPERHRVQDSFGRGYLRQLPSLSDGPVAEEVVVRLREVSADPSRVDKLAMVMHRMTKAMKHGKLKGMPPDVIDNLADSFVRNAEFASPKASSLMLHSMLKLRARPSAMLQDAALRNVLRGLELGRAAPMDALMTLHSLALVAKEGWGIPQSEPLERMAKAILLADGELPGIDPRETATLLWSAGTLRVTVGAAQACALVTARAAGMDSTSCSVAMTGLRDLAAASGFDVARRASQDIAGGADGDGRASTRQADDAQGSIAPSAWSAAASALLARLTELTGGMAPGQGRAAQGLEPSQGKPVASVSDRDVNGVLAGHGRGGVSTRAPWDGDGRAEAVGADSARSSSASGASSRSSLLTPAQWETAMAGAFALRAHVPPGRADALSGALAHTLGRRGLLYFMDRPWSLASLVRHLGGVGVRIEGQLLSVLHAWLDGFGSGMHAWGPAEVLPVLRGLGDSLRAGPLADGEGEVLAGVFKGLMDIQVASICGEASGGRGRDGGGAGPSQGTAPSPEVVARACRAVFEWGALARTQGVSPDLSGIERLFGVVVAGARNSGCDPLLVRDALVAARWIYRGCGSRPLLDAVTALESACIDAGVWKERPRRRSRGGASAGPPMGKEGEGAAKQLRGPRQATEAQSFGHRAGTWRARAKEPSRDDDGDPSAGLEAARQGSDISTTAPQRDGLVSALLVNSLGFFGESPSEVTRSSSRRRRSGSRAALDEGQAASSRCFGEGTVAKSSEAAAGMGTAPGVQPSTLGLEAGGAGLEAGVSDAGDGGKGGVGVPRVGDDSTQSGGRWSLWISGDLLASGVSGLRTSAGTRFVRDKLHVAEHKWIDRPLQGPEAGPRRTRIARG